EGAITEDKLGVIRSATYRDAQAKYKVEREFRTVFIVSGETTTSDGATRGCYPMVQAAASRRRGNHMLWFQEHEAYFFLVLRRILQHRAQFVQVVMNALQRWMVDPALEGVHERSKLVHGVSYAGWLAAAGLLESHDGEKATAFRRFVQEYTRYSAADVRSEVNVSVFWNDLMNAVEAGEVDLKYF